jgi:hypothetical protein
MGLQDKLADARKAAERARAQQQEWSQGRHEAKEQQAVARQETEAQEKAAVDARVAEEGWWTHPDAFKAFGRSGSLPVTKCDYLGGWSEHPKGHSDNQLEIDAAGLRYKGFKTILLIPWDQVEAIEVEGPDQASKRVSAGRVMMIGVFALAAKKSVKSAVLTITMKSGEQAVFQTHEWMALDLKAKLSPVLSQLRQLPAATPSATPAPALSSADEIRKLAELRDAGILTEAEFQAKKAELLARM